MAFKRGIILAVIAIVAVLALISFYSLLGQREAAQSVRISFGGLQQKSLDQTTATFGLDLNMFNPSSTNVNFDHIIYDLYANGTHVGNGTMAGPEIIAPSNTINVSSDGTISYAGPLKSLLSNQRNGSVSWEMRGVSYFERPILGLIQVPFDVSIPSTYLTNPSSQGDTNVVVTKPSAGKKQNPIPSISTHISLQPSIIRVSQGQTAGFTGQLTDTTGKGIANQKIYLKSETPLWLVPTLGLASTDSSGWFAINWKANQTNWNSDVADIYAVFGGSHGYLSAKSNSVHLEVLVSSLKPTPQPTPHLQNTTSEIVHEASPVYQVGIGTYSDIPFNVPCQVTATGSFTTDAENDKNIIVTLFDQTNHDLFQKNMPYSVNYYSGKVQSGNFTLNLQPGIYYLMLSNTYSFYPKTVTIHASYYCN